MHRVAIIATENTVATTFTGPMDMFHQAGRLFNRIFRKPETPIFDVTLATVSGTPFETRSGIRVMPHCRAQDIQQTDLIILSSIGHITRALAGHKDTIGWLRHHHHQGTPIAAVCTGAFLLAETGLLDGKTATTHWGFADLFAKMYPNVRFKPHRLITDEAGLFCSGGFNAAFDLCIYLIEKICGRNVAMQSAKTVLHDMGRRHQSPYSMMGPCTGHGDDQIRRTQAWMADHYAQKITSPGLAARFGMSRRTFERRFKAATGMTPLRYLQQIRVEAAKRLLEQTRHTFDEITRRVGYEDTSSFRKVFVKLAGLRPKMYQLKFQSEGDLA